MYGVICRTSIADFRKQEEFVEYLWGFELFPSIH